MNDLERASASSVKVGLAQNKAGVRFHCPECEYFNKGKCENKNPKLYGRKVTTEMCCNLFDRPDMRKIVD